MDKILDLKLARKIKVNRLLINFRWLYIAVIYLVVVFFQGFYSPDALKNDIIKLSLVIIFVYAINAILYLSFLKIERNQQAKFVTVLSFLQIVTEFIFLITFLQCITEPKSFILFFFFLPIIASSLAFEFNAAIFVAVISVVVIASQTYFEIILRLPVGSLIGQLDESIEYKLIENITIAIFYLIIGLFSGYGANLLRVQEKIVGSGIAKINEEKDEKTKEMERMDRTAQLLVKRDLELTNLNAEYNKKIIELEKSKETLLKAFKDVQKAGAEIEEEKNKTLTIISNFTSPILVLDKENKIILFNQAARKILGVRFLDYGRRIETKNNFGLENFKNIIRANFSFSILDEQSADNVISTEEMIIKGEESDIVFKVVTAKISGPSKGNLGIMKIFYDMTREKMLDKLKSEFISVAAHQLRTPLAAIKWIFEEVLSGDSGDVNEEQRKYLNKGHESNERIISLVNDLLNVSRIEEGRFGFNFVKLNFLKILDQVIAEVDSFVKSKSIKLVVEKSDDLPDMYIDQEKITMVLQNTIENAVKYTPENGKIEVRVVKDGENLKIEIQDNGVGIPEKDQKKLFSKFFRASNVVRLQTEGTGLGLFIAKNIIEKHGGTIGMESKEGSGTKVTITLPINNSI